MQKARLESGPQMIRPRMCGASSNFGWGTRITRRRFACASPVRADLPVVILFPAKKAEAPHSRGFLRIWLGD